MIDDRFDEGCACGDADDDERGTGGADTGAAGPDSSAPSGQSESDSGDLDGEHCVASLDSPVVRAEEALVAAAAARILGVKPGSLGVERLPGHASARTYYRARVSPRPTSASVVVMVLPPGEGGEEVGSNGPPELEFLEVQRYLHELGVRVPRVWARDRAAGLLVLEDLGSTTLEDALVASNHDPRTRRRLYGQAIDQLAFMRRQAERHPSPESVPFKRAFDRELLRWELDHFVEWCMEAHYEARPTASERRLMAECFDEIAARLAELPRGLTHRDYQSRNLMVVPEGLAVIDFQDALLGPMAYDLVALLRDSYVVLGEEIVQELLNRYCDACRALGGTPVEREELEEQFDLQTVQRKLKDAGRFVFIERVKDNPSFMPYMEPSLVYVADALAKLPEYKELWATLAAYVPPLRRPPLAQGP